MPNQAVWANRLPHAKGFSVSTQSDTHSIWAVGRPKYRDWGLEPNRNLQAKRPRCSRDKKPWEGGGMGGERWERQLARHWEGWSMRERSRLIGCANCHILFSTLFLPQKNHSCNINSVNANEKLDREGKWLEWNKGTATGDIRASFGVVWPIIPRVDTVHWNRTKRKPTTPR